MDKKFNRLTAKTAARNSIRTCQPSPLSVTLLYLLLTAVVTGVVEWVTGNSYLAAIMEYILMGYEVDEAIGYVLGRGLETSAFSGVIALLLTLYQVLMSFGYTSYALRLARNEKPGYARLFDGFVKPWRVWGVVILEGLLLMLWGLLLVLFLAGILIANVKLESTDLDTLVTLVLLTLALYGALAVPIAVAVEIVVSLRYRLAYYILLDDPDCTAWESLKRSRAAMKGWKKQLFLLDLSFLPWVLLEILTLGVAGIWVCPYKEVVVARFYDAVMGDRQTTGESSGYMGPIYREEPDLGPKSF